MSSSAVIQMETNLAYNFFDEEDDEFLSQQPNKSKREVYERPATLCERTLHFIGKLWRWLVQGLELFSKSWSGSFGINQV